MSISNLLGQNNYDIIVNNLTVEGTLTPLGPIVSGGNISVINSSPTISILNNTTNSNRATLLLQAQTAVIPASVQQGTSGVLRITGNNTSTAGQSNNIELDALQNGDVVVNPQGSPGGHLVLIGSQYVAGPYNLALNSSNQVVRSPVPGAITQTGSITSTVAFNGVNCNITTISNPNITPGSGAGFTFSNSSILTTSVIQLTINYGGAGFVLVNYNLQTTGSIFIAFNNVSSSTINSSIKISVSIFN